MLRKRAEGKEGKEELNLRRNKLGEKVENTTKARMSRRLTKASRRLRQASRRQGGQKGIEFETQQAGREG